jgi:hypothetical protein
MLARNRSSSALCLAVLAIVVMAFVFLLNIRHTSSRPAKEAPSHLKGLTILAQLG